MIDPGTAVDGEEFEAYNRRRWGSSGWTHHLKQEGRKDGAGFQNWQWWPNTLMAHRLVWFACDKKATVDTSRANAALFEAIYEEGENISLVDTLARVGETELNLDQDEVKRFLQGSEGTKEVKEEIEVGQRRYRISGVPFFVIGKPNQTPYGLSGAQPTRAFLQVFRELSEEE